MKPGIVHGSLHVNRVVTDQGKSRPPTPTQVSQVNYTLFYSMPVIYNILHYEGTTNHKVCCYVKIKMGFYV